MKVEVIDDPINGEVSAKQNEIEMGGGAIMEPDSEELSQENEENKHEMKMGGGVIQFDDEMVDSSTVDSMGYSIQEHMDPQGVIDDNDIGSVLIEKTPSPGSPLATPRSVVSDAASEATE